MNPPVTSPLNHSDPTEPSLLPAYLADFDAMFDSAFGMTQRPWKGPGYHSQILPGSLVHETRESLNYALALVIEGSPASLQRAESILARVLPLQDLDSSSATYGVWPWLAEEPLQEMRPPDWNWADFCGACLAHLLSLHADRLTASTRAAAEQGLRAAAYSIFRRNVGPDYTNIAFKGGVVVAIAGEYFSDETLRTYALQRLTRFTRHVRENGGFTEYNSPIYSMVVLNEAERGLQLVRDDALRAPIHETWTACWKEITDFLHLQTGQRCGPQSRTYVDIMHRHFSLVLQARLGLSWFIPPAALRSLGSPVFLSTPVPCPREFRDNLLASDTAPVEARHPFIRARGSIPSRVGTVWRSGDACLGSVNFDTFWNQRRPILGYWRVGNGLAIFRVSVRHKKHDFCSGAVRSQQASGALAVICSLATERGDSHDVLDKPQNGVFLIEDLHVAIQLESPDLTVSVRDDGRYVLAAGEWSMWVSPKFASMSGAMIDWTIEKYPERALVRATINRGAELSLCPATLAEMTVGFGLDLRRSRDDSPPPEWAWARDEAHISLWQEVGGGRGVSVTAPVAPQPI